jgi:tRNA threonylcarbamoyl adenosine modification protein YeaZ
MLILAFDTTSEQGGVGIFRDAECLALVPNAGTAERYSISLFEMVQQALTQSHLELPEIELYAAAHGPGSFTGIRVGLAAARAWGKVFERPVRGVSVLEAMVSKLLPKSDWAFPILDGRRGEFYVSGFRRRPCPTPGASARNYEAADAGWILNPDALGEFVAEHLKTGESATCVVRAHDQAAAALRANLPTSLNWQNVEGILVDSIAAIAREEEQLRLPGKDEKLDAYYLRRPDAELNWKA